MTRADFPGSCLSKRNKLLPQQSLGWESALFVQPNGISSLSRIPIPLQALRGTSPGAAPHSADLSREHGLHWESRSESPPTQRNKRRAPSLHSRLPQCGPRKDKPQPSRSCILACCEPLCWWLSLPDAELCPTCLPVWARPRGQAPPTSDLSQNPACVRPPTQLWSDTWEVTVKPASKWKVMASELDA